jgi:hypothetical protein
MDEYVSRRQFIFLFQQGAALGAKMALIKTGKLKPYITKREAFRRYGRNKVNKWIDEGLVTIRKDGTQSAYWRIDLIEIEIVLIANEILIKF